MINDNEKEKLLDRFYFLQTLTIAFKNEQKAEGTKATTLTPDMFKLIGRCLLTPAKLEPLLALVIFLDSALNTSEVTQINRTLKEAISTNNFTREYVDPIYDANFARVTELIGDRKEELLRKAAETGNALAVAQLLKINGIDVNAKDKSGWTALMYASWKGHASVVTELLKMNDKVNGILVNAKDKSGWTALMYASSHGHASVVTELLKVNGILVNAKDISGWTALIYASINGHASVVTELLKVNGILVNTKSKNDTTALMCASSHGHASVVHQLCIKQLFDAPYDYDRTLFHALAKQISDDNSSIIFTETSLCNHLQKSVAELPTKDEKITLLEKALSGTNAFSAVIHHDQRVEIEAVLTALKPSQESPPVIFSNPSVASASSNANTSPRLH